MKRLTIRNSDGTVSQPTGTAVEDVFYRLADYEDTEMTPEEIEEMKIDLCDKQALLENSRNEGEWLSARDKDFLYVEVCSVCNYVERYNIEPDLNKSMPFCPNCGSHNRSPYDRRKAVTLVD